MIPLTFFSYNQSIYLKSNFKLSMIKTFMFCLVAALCFIGVTFADTGKIFFFFWKKLTLTLSQIWFLYELDAEQQHYMEPISVILGTKMTGAYRVPKVKKKKKLHIFNLWWKTNFSPVYCIPEKGKKFLSCRLWCVPWQPLLPYGRWMLWDSRYLLPSWLLLHERRQRILQSRGLLP